MTIIILKREKNINDYSSIIKFVIKETLQFSSQEISDFFKIQKKRGE